MSIYLIRIVFYGLLLFLISCFFKYLILQVLGGVGFIRDSYRPHKIKSPVYRFFKNMVVSLLLACIYGFLLDHVPATS